MSQHPKYSGGGAEPYGAPCGKSTGLHKPAKLDKVSCKQNKSDEFNGYIHCFCLLPLFLPFAFDHRLETIGKGRMDLVQRDEEIVRPGAGVRGWTGRETAEDARCRGLNPRT